MRPVLSVITAALLLPTGAAASTVTTPVSLDSADAPGEHSFVLGPMPEATETVRLTVHQRTDLDAGDSISVLLGGGWYDSVLEGQTTPCSWRQQVVFVPAPVWNARYDGSTLQVDLHANPGAAACPDGGAAYLELSFTDSISDLDGDGFAVADGDCDDSDALINPNAAELCDAVDQDCDGEIDETFDVDGDGWTFPCGADGVDGTGDEDCKDGVAEVNPGAREDCANGVDFNCDGLTTEGADRDGDGETDCLDTVGDCPDCDCDDWDPLVNHAAPELCDGIDNNCGVGAYLPNFDFESVDEGCLGPCDVLVVDDDDDDPNVSGPWLDGLTALGMPTSIWTVDGQDDGPPATVMRSFDVVVFFSGDKYGTSTPWAPGSGPSQQDEIELATYLEDGGALLLSAQDYYSDYNQSVTSFMADYLGVESVVPDTNGDVTAGGGDGSVFRGVDTSPFSSPFVDGFPVNMPAGELGYEVYVDQVSPSADALAAFTTDVGAVNGISREEAAGLWRSIYLTWGLELVYWQETDTSNALLASMMGWLQGDCAVDPDRDGDGSLHADDCDDADPARAPGKPGLCGDGVDNDCDGLADAADPDAAAYAYYPDGDGDGSGDMMATPSRSCTPLPGYVLNNDDCDDTSGIRSPVQDEVCADGVDQDCDGLDSPDSDSDGVCDSEDPCPLVSTNDSDLDGICDNEDVCAGLDDAILTAPLGVVRVGQRSGMAAAAGGDVDGDGAPDVVVVSETAVTLWGGGANPPVLVDEITIPGDASELFGASVALGDLNGDGFSDVIVGDPGHDGIGRADVGRILVFQGKAGGINASATGLLLGTSPGEALGAVLASGGDVSGDGLDDLITTSASAGGALRVFRGQAGAATVVDSLPMRTYTHAYDDGFSLAVAPDTNGDGIDDLLIGSPDAATAWAVVSPLPASGELATQATVTLSSSAATGHGHRVVGLGDLNGDGFGEVAVAGRPGASGTGSLVVFSGSATGPQPAPPYVSIFGTFPGDDLGPVAADDFDGDGEIDLAIGAPGVAGGGRLYVFKGPVSGLLTPADALWSTLGLFGLVADPTGGRFGELVLAPGDIDLDGDADLLVAAPDQILSLDDDGQVMLLDVSGILSDADGDDLPDMCDECPLSPGGDGDEDGFCAPDDCDDTEEGVHPGADEGCDGVDSDCDGTLGAAEVDHDGDGFNDCNGDCDDDDNAAWPGATELCDGVDNDCDGSLGVDEQDNDADGHFACDDCDDTNSAIFPGAEELCNARDDDCDGVLPDDEADADVDGFMPCTGDCDDTALGTNPAAAEICGDGIDQDCSGEDLICTENPDETNFCGNREVSDLDGDGYTCEVDCEDNDPNVNPGMDPRVCDYYVDTNCDGVADPADRCGSGCSLSAQAAPTPWAFLLILGAALPLRRKRARS